MLSSIHRLKYVQPPSLVATPPQGLAQKFDPLFLVANDDARDAFGRSSCEVGDGDRLPVRIQGRAILAGLDYWNYHD